MLFCFLDRLCKAEGGVDAGFQDIFREFRVCNGARHLQRADHAAEDADGGLLAGLWRQVLWQEGGDFGEECFEAFGIGGAGWFRMTGDFRGEGGDNAALTGVVPVGRAQIGADEGFKAGAVFDAASVEGGVHGFLDQGFLGIEVRVEAAMGEPGFRHEGCDADRVDAFFAEFC